MVQADSRYPRTETLDAYFNEIKNHELLSRQQEKMLAMRYRESDDDDAADRLISANLRLVVKIASGYYKKGGRFSLSDLIQEGNLGLIQAARHYDPEKQTKFSYYAVFWIKAYILKFLMDNYSSIKIGTTQAQRRLFFNLRKTREKLERRHGQATPERIARKLGVKTSDVEEMQRRIEGTDRSLEEPNGRRSKERFIDRLVSDGSSAEEMVSQRQMVGMLRRQIEAFRSDLSDREAAILERRIVADEPLTLQKLGQHFGVSRERIRQVEARIIQNLKNYLQTNIPDFANYVVN